MEFPFTPSPELMEKANAAKTPEELLALAKESGMELTAQQAQDYFAQLHQTGELADDELDNVSGGCAPAGNPQRPPAPGYYVCQYFAAKGDGEAGCANCRYAQSAGRGQYYCTHSSNFDHS